MQSVVVAHDCLTLKNLINTTALMEIDLKRSALEKEAFHIKKRQRYQLNLGNSSSQRIRVEIESIWTPFCNRAKNNLSTQQVS